MRRLIICLIVAVFNLSYSQEIVVALKGLESGDVRELLFRGEDIVVIVLRNKLFNDRAFKKLLGLSYEDYKLYRFQLAIEGVGTPPKEVSTEELIKTIRDYNRVIVVAPKRILPILKILRGIKVIVER